MQSPLGSLFDTRSMLVSVSGAGNNWAHGHHMYGPQYRVDVMVRLPHLIRSMDFLPDAHVHACDR